MTSKKPIDDPHTGHYQVVVSFRVKRNPDGWGPEEIKAALRRRLALWPSPYNPTEDLNVQIGETLCGHDPLGTRKRAAT